MRLPVGRNGLHIAYAHVGTRHHRTLCTNIVGRLRVGRVGACRQPAFLVLERVLGESRALASPGAELDVHARELSFGIGGVACQGNAIATDGCAVDRDTRREVRRRRTELNRISAHAGRCTIIVLCGRDRHVECVRRQIIERDVPICRPRRGFRWLRKAAIQAHGDARDRAGGQGRQAAYGHRISGGRRGGDRDGWWLALTERVRLEEGPLQLAGARSGRIGELPAVVADPIVRVGSDKIATLAVVEDRLDDRTLRAAILRLGAGHAFSRTIRRRNRAGVQAVTADPGIADVLRAQYVDYTIVARVNGHYGDG